MRLLAVLAVIILAAALFIAAPATERVVCHANASRDVAAAGWRLRHGHASGVLLQRLTGASRVLFVD